MVNYESVTVSLTKDLVKAINKVLKKEDRKLSWLYRKAMEEYLAKHYSKDSENA